MADKVELSQEEQESLGLAQLVAEMRKTRGWQEIVEPWLKTKFSNSWLDPRNSKDQTEFFYQYSTAWAFAQAVTEIFRYLDETQAKADYLIKKQKGELVDKFAIGK